MESLILLPSPGKTDLDTIMGLNISVAGRHARANGVAEGFAEFPRRDSRGRAVKETTILRAIESGLAAVDRAIILAERGGRIRWKSPLARVWLDEFIHTPADSSAWLPRAFRLSICGLEHGAYGHADRTHCHFVRLMGRGGYRFVARIGVTPEGLFIILTRERLGFDLFVAQHFGLTRRQGEVLCWVSEGKTNDEIGRILGISARTVQKHAQLIFLKLGVENRSAAQRLVSEFRSQ